MIDPYGFEIRAVQHSLSRLGLELTEESDESMIFSRGSLAVTFATEQHYHPALLANIRDHNGTVYELGLLIGIVDPVMHKDMIDKLQNLRAKYRFHSRPLEEVMADGSLAEYVRLSLQFFLNFFGKYENVVFEPTPSIREEYARRSKELLRQFGVG